jgi:hypothetical protein
MAYATRPCSVLITETIRFTSWIVIGNAYSPAVKSLTFCLRAQFDHIQAALTPQSNDKYHPNSTTNIHNLSGYAGGAAHIP